jgi:predicted transcriptional regulator
MEHTIMTEKIARRGVKTPHSFESDILERLTVKQVIIDNVITISEDNSIGEVQEWLKKEQGFKSDYFIISNSGGGYKGILNHLSLYGTNNSLENKIGTLLKDNHTFIGLNDTLRMAAEMMAKESTDVLPVVSNENKSIIGILSYHDILATYKHGIDVHETKRPHISLKISGLKMVLHGQKLTSFIRRKNK